MMVSSSRPVHLHHVHCTNVVMSQPSRHIRRVANPATLPPSPRAGLGYERAHGRGRALVLYINGDTDSRILLSHIARRWHGVRLILTETGGRGRHLTLTHRPSLILLDDHLPDLDSHDLLTAIRQDDRTSTTPVVVLSADPGTRASFTRAGTTAWFTKPLHIAHVERTAMGLLELADTR